MSATFNTENLEKKLVQLNDSLQSIQTLSLWLIHHRKHHKSVVQTWFKSLRQAKEPAKKLTLMYLANDVIQNMRKKGPEYSKEFATVLKSSFEIIAKNCDDKTWLKLGKILNVWEERSIYQKEQVEEFRSAIGERKVTATAVAPSKTSASATKRPSEPAPKAEAKKTKTAIPNTTPTPKVVAEITDGLNIPLPQEGVVINSEILVRALQDMEKSASKDSKTRDKIANLPQELTDPSSFGKLKDKKIADKLLKQLEDASKLLNKYNEELSQELDQRKAIGIMLATFIKNQSDSLTKSEQQLNQFKEKLKQVDQVKKHLKAHLQNLPDLRMLPSIMAPLPSAGDLFNAAAQAAARKSSSVGSSPVSPGTSPDTPTTPF